MRTTHKLRKTLWHVAVRSAAVKAAAQAFPELSTPELADALGLGRRQVQHYLSGSVKTSLNELPAWSHGLLEACRSLSIGDMQTAAMQLADTARKIEAA